jgi:hypothetical protein
MPSLRSQQALTDSSSIAKSSVEGYDLFSLIRKTNGDFQSAQQLSQQIGPIIAFPTYVTHFVEPLADDAIRRLARQFQLRVLALLEPSPTMRESSGMSFGPSENGDNLFIFRVSQAVPAHAPTLDQVRDKVLADAKLVAAYDLAKADAAKFIATAQSQKLHLKKSAEAANKPLITTGLFGTRSTSIERYALPAGESVSLFINGAFSLLSAGPVGDPHPVGTFDLQPTATVLAAEINQVQPGWTPQSLPTEQLFASLGSEFRYAEILRYLWLRVDDVLARTGWKPAEGAKSPQAPAPTEPPLNPLGGA